MNSFSFLFYAIYFLSSQHYFSLVSGYTSNMNFLHFKKKRKKEMCLPNLQLQPKIKKKQFSQRVINAEQFR